MAVSTDISPVPSSSSSAKLKHKKTMSFKKKKNLGPEITPPVKLTAKKTSQATDSTRKSQQSQVDMNSPAMLRAKEFQSTLPAKYPSFVKYMLKSHVSGGFWLGLPSSFSSIHMPKQDVSFLLVEADAMGKEYGHKQMVKYLAEKSGLSGGWKAFSVAHKLVEGDVLVFQVFESLKIKVYIMRANQSDEAIDLLNLHSLANAVDSNADSEDEYEDDKTIIQLITPNKCSKPRGLGTHSHQEDSTRKSLESEPAATLQQTGNTSDSEHVASTLQQTENKSNDMEGQEGIRLAESVLELKDIEGFESFNVIIDGIIVDSEIPTHLRSRYFDLCCNQKSFLHDDLVKGLNFKLAAGIILETVNIAEAIKAAKLTASLEDLQSWDRTLKAFEDMGMKVGFLRTRLDKLICFLCEHQETIGLKKQEQARIEEEIRDLKDKLSKRCEAKKTVDAELEALCPSAEISFKKIANAAW